MIYSELSGARKRGGQPLLTDGGTELSVVRPIHALGQHPVICYCRLPVI